MALLRTLADPGVVARLQRFCGVEYEKPATCDQQTQTRRESSDSDSGCEHDGQPSSISSNKTATTDSPVSTPVTVNSGNISQIAHRIAPENDLEEYYNNLNTAVSNTYSGDLNQNEIIERKKSSTNFPNGYHIVKCNNRAPTKNGISEYSEYLPSIKLTKCTDDNNAPKTTDNPAQPTSPAVSIKYKSLLYLAYFGAFLGNEEFYLTFFPFGVWNFDSILFRQVKGKKKPCI